MAGINSTGGLHHLIYQRLHAVIPQLQDIQEHGKSVVPGYMDLNLDVLERGSNRTVIALSHYYRHPSGDMIADPDMVVAVYSEKAMAEALSYQDIFGYREVYSHGGSLVDVRAKRDQNQFLKTWLANLIEQGHRIELETVDAVAAGGEDA